MTPAEVLPVVYDKLRPVARARVTSAAGRRWPRARVIGRAGPRGSTIARRPRLGLSQADKALDHLAQAERRQDDVIPKAAALADSLQEVIRRR